MGSICSNLVYIARDPNLGMQEGGEDTEGPCGKTSFCSGRNQEICFQGGKGATAPQFWHNYFQPTRKGSGGLSPPKYLVPQQKIIANAPENAGKHRNMPGNAGKLELLTYSVFFGQYWSVFLGIYCTDTEGKLSRYFQYRRYKKVRIYSK